MGMDSARRNKAVGTILLIEYSVVILTCFMEKNVIIFPFFQIFFVYFNLYKMNIKYIASKNKLNAGACDS